MKTIENKGLAYMVKNKSPALITYLCGFQKAGHAQKLKLRLTSSKNLLDEKSVRLVEKLEEISRAEDKEAKSTRQLITDSARKLEGKAEEISAMAENQFGELGRKVSSECHLTREKVDESIRETKTSFEQLEALFAGQVTEIHASMDQLTMETREDLEKKYKILLAFSISFGAVNILGMLVAILLHFM